MDHDEAELPDRSGAAVTVSRCIPPGPHAVVPGSLGPSKPARPSLAEGPAGTAHPRDSQMGRAVEAGGQSAQAPFFQAGFVTQISWTLLATALRVAATASSMASCPTAPWKTASTSR